jgi:hypothetical protein
MEVSDQLHLAAGLSPGKIPGKVRFQVLTAMNMNVAVFWDVAPCSLIDIDLRPGRADEDEAPLKRRSVLPEYTAQHPRRQPSSALVNIG